MQPSTQADMESADLANQARLPATGQSASTILGPGDPRPQRVSCLSASACYSWLTSGLRYRITVTPLATLLLWLSWRDPEPEPSVWARLLQRARQRSRLGGSEKSGPGYRLYVAPTRAAEPTVVLQRRAADGDEEVLLLDRANGTDDKAVRGDMEWTDARLGDGTPTAAVRLWPSLLKVQLYRDLMGQRTLVYARIAGGLLVATGEDVLRAHPAVSAELDPLYLAAYFAGLSPAHDSTAFRDIRVLGAGETLIGDASELRCTQETLEADDSWKGMRDADIVERFRELFERSVQSACRGGRRVGISLSAGLDSGSIAAVASRLPIAKLGGVVGITQGLDAFPDIDERAMVGNLANELGIQHLSFAADGLTPYSSNDLHPVCPDAPLQSPFRAWKETSCRMANSAGADIWLAGDFADDLFSGGVEWVVDALRYRRWRLMVQQLSRMWHDQGAGAILRDTAVRRPVSRALGRVSLHSARLKWLQPGYRSVIAERLQAEAERYRDFPRPQHCVRLLDANAAFNASAEQWFTHRHGLEQRLPFRDLALTRWCLSLPADFFVRDGQRKWLLRESVRGVLPETLRMRIKGSDLTPVFNQAVLTHASTLEALRHAAGPFPAQFLDASAMRKLDPDERAVADWLVSSFGSWRLSVGSSGELL